jgi:hypothetical protein
MLPVADAIDQSMSKLIRDLLAALEGIPDDDFTTWRPAAARDDPTHEMNTFAALATHTLGAAEYWSLMAAGARLMTRVRDEEFIARTTPAEVRGRAETYLADLHALLTELTDADLAADVATRLHRDGQHWPLAACLLHAVDHTALHLGHVQIQRQLWEYERSA